MLQAVIESPTLTKQDQDSVVDAHAYMETFVWYNQAH